MSIDELIDDLQGFKKIYGPSIEVVKTKTSACDGKTVYSSIRATKLVGELKLQSASGGMLNQHPMIVL